MAGKKKSSKRRILLLILVLLILIGAFAYFIMRSGPEKTNYASTEVTYGDVSNSFSFTGTVEVPNSQTLTASASSAIRELYVTANQTVKKGDRLLRLEDGSTLKAELAGEVSALYVQKGDYVSSGKTLMTITDMNRMGVTIDIDEYDVAAISPGKTVDVSITALNQKCGGTITGFNKQANTSGQIAYYTATVSIEAPEGLLPGMQVEVTLTKESAENTLLVKADAVQFTDSNLAFVLVSDGGNGYTMRMITTGISDGMNVQVLSGLSAGEKVYYTPTGSSMMEMFAAMGGGSGGSSGGFPGGGPGGFGQ